MIGVSPLPRRKSRSIKRIGLVQIAVAVAQADVQLQRHGERVVLGGARTSAGRGPSVGDAYRAHASGWAASVTSFCVGSQRSPSKPPR